MVPLIKSAAAAAAAASSFIPGGSGSTGTVSSAFATVNGVNGTGTNATGNVGRVHARHWPQANLSGSGAPNIPVPTKSSRQPKVGNTANGNTPFVTITPTVRDPSDVGRSSTSSPSKRSTAQKPPAASASHPPQPKSGNKSQASYAIRGKGLPTGETEGEVTIFGFKDGSTKKFFKPRDAPPVPVTISPEKCPSGQQPRLHPFEGNFQCMSKKKYTGLAYFGSPMATTYATVAMNATPVVVTVIAGALLGACATKKSSK